MHKITRDMINIGEMFVPLTIDLDNVFTRDISSSSKTDYDVVFSLRCKDVFSCTTLEKD